MSFLSIFVLILLTITLLNITFSKVKQDVSNDNAFFYCHRNHFMNVLKDMYIYICLSNLKKVSLLLMHNVKKKMKEEIKNWETKKLKRGSFLIYMIDVKILYCGNKWEIWLSGEVFLNIKNTQIGSFFYKFYCYSEILS